MELNLDSAQRHLNSFKDYYLEFAWPTLKGDLEFRGSTYLIDCLTEHAEAFYAGQIRELIIAIPPRNGKTTLFTVALPTWIWLNSPSSDILTVSASDPVIRDFHHQRQEIFTTPYYQAIWQSLYSCSISNDSIERVDNTSGGTIHQWTHLCTRTGLGYNYGIFDDCNPVSQARNKNYLEKVSTEFTNSSLSRRHNKKIAEASPTMIVQQRVAEIDLAGVMKEKGYTYLELQAISEERQTFIMPISGKEWVREQNSVLNPDLEDLDSLLRLKEQSEGFQAQYQQRPLVTEGACIQVEELHFYKEYKSPKDYDYTVLSIDTAATTGSKSANWAYVFMGKHYIDGNPFYDVLFSYADKHEYPSGKAKTIELIEKLKPDQVFIENKSTGLSLIPELCIVYPEYPNIIPIIPVGSKEDRSMMAIPLVKSRVRFPDAVALPDTIWVALLMYEVLGFPNAATNDLMDALTQYLNTANKGQVASDFYGL